VEQMKGRYGVTGVTFTDASSAAILSKMYEH